MNPLSIQYLRRGPIFQCGSSAGFEWVVADLPVPSLPPHLDGLRLLHLSDLHMRQRWDPAYDDLIQRVAANPPDLMLFTGDFAEERHDHRPIVPLLKKLLDALPARIGRVAILGNHDGDLLPPRLADCDLTFINHRRLLLHSGDAGADATIELIGLGGVERRDLDVPWLRTLPPRQPSSLRIVMSHFPDAWRKTEFLNPDLYLCGHTHGGQICLPGRIPILPHDTLPRKYWQGIHRIKETWFIAHRGFGFSTIFPVRLFCPAEVIEIRLRGPLRNNDPTQLNSSEPKSML